MIKVFKILFCLNLLPCLAQCLDPHSQAWAELPDAPVNRSYGRKGISQTLHMVDAQTGKPVAGAMIRCGDCGARTDSTGTAIFFIPLLLIDDSLHIVAPGYEEHTVSIEYLVQNYPAPVIALKPLIRPEDGAGLPLLTTDALRRILADIRSTALTEAPWAAWLVADEKDEDAPGYWWSEYQMWRGELYAPLGFASTALCDPAGWQFRINSGWFSPERPDAVALLRYWLEMDLLLPFGPWADSLSMEALPARQSGAMPWYGLGWEKQGSSGKIWFTPDGSLIWQEIISADRQQRSVRSRIGYQRVDGRLLPVAVEVWMAGGQRMKMQMLQKGPESVRCFRGNFCNLPARLAHRDYREPYGRPMIEQFDDFDD